MKTQTQLLRKTALAAAVAIVVSGVGSVGGFAGLETGMSSIISSAYAGDGGSGGGQKGAMGENRGGQGGHGAGSQGHKGGRSVADVLADDDDGDDSDRPDWAGVPGGEGRPGGGGNPNPGNTKGDVYGDMIVVVRDPVTGVPLDVNGLPTHEEGELLVCTDSNCTYEDKDSWVEKTDDGEIPTGVTPIEVDLAGVTQDEGLCDLLAAGGPAPSLMRLLGRNSSNGRTVRPVASSNLRGSTGFLATDCAFVDCCR